MLSNTCILMVALGLALSKSALTRKNLYLIKSFLDNIFLLFSLMNFLYKKIFFALNSTSLGFFKKIVCLNRKMSVEYILKFSTIF